ncbi:hypothetical protein RZS08_03720, partial [Arthrospira platensis SPKY1]|nr:hypothetical protein [Arthrospira platensis SPKY1]
DALPIWIIISIKITILLAKIRMMNRRTFTEKLTLGLPFLALGSTKASAPRLATPERLLPRRLQPGDTIGIITPGSFISDEDFQKAVDKVLSFGFRVKLGKYV